MSNTKTEAQRLAVFANELAVRFSEGWHDGIKIDASDIMDLSKVEYELRSLDAQNKAMHKIIDQLRAQLAKAVTEEREACKRTCMDIHKRNDSAFALECALAIEARSNT